MTAERSDIPIAEPIAVVGMRARVPGAEDTDEMWHNFANGVESITALSTEEMRASGVDDTVLALPGYVNAAPLLRDVDKFDAAFFGFSARDAALTDPQHRIFLETSWEAIEDSGYDPATYPGPIGVFGGCEMSTYLFQLFGSPDALGYVDGMQLMVTNDKDHLCTQVSYRLDLRGPSVVVQTTCSTSLVAVALACESLNSNHCDMALAGGVTVRVPQRGGYFYVPGSILSPDGHCRPFDMSAQGTIVGSGVGIVVLKRLRDALADEDHIHAVIRGVGLNNDGHDKVGYTAPGVTGQVAAIGDAYRAAGVSPETVGYVEAHGTGTILGDPIEFTALTEVFRKYTTRSGYCGIGSAKSNFGHLSCASGVVGLIKAVLCIENGGIPPTVHYRAPNPAIDFVSSPFFVTQDLHPWPRNGLPRRAAVSSFGVGGTNAHAVIEEAPHRDPLQRRRPFQLLTLSARSTAALSAASQRLGAHLTRHPELDLADVAHTLHVGRRAFAHRCAHVVPAADRAHAVSALLDPGRPSQSSCPETPPDVIFLFPGQGAQYPGMAADLYRSEPVVRREIDDCCRILEPDLGLDLRSLIFADRRRDTPAAEALRNTAMAQPALFVIGYAVAQLWLSWGIRPTAMIGHSVGEYVAATLSGVLSRDDALRLIAERGRLIAELPAGSMLAVMADPASLAAYLDDYVCLAAVNAPQLCVLSGPHDAINRVEIELQSRSIAAHRLHTSHAFHSSMMDPMLDCFAALIDRITLSPPTIPYVATLTGHWADGEVTHCEYWTRQIRSTVRFADALAELRTGQDAPVLLEVGPGRTLLSAARSNGATSAERMLPSLPAADEDKPATETALSSLGALWTLGVDVDWPGFHRTEPRRRVSLPTYPFERQSYWIGRPNTPGGADPATPRDVTAWFSRPVWSESEPVASPPTESGGSRVLVLVDDSGVAEAIIDELLTRAIDVILVRHATSYKRINDSEYLLDPDDDASPAALLAGVCADGPLSGVICCWGADSAAADLCQSSAATFMTPLRISVALAASGAGPLPVLLVSRNTAAVYEEDTVDPGRCFGIGAARVLPQELTNLSITHVDVDDGRTASVHIVDEFLSGATESEVAYRNGRRYLRTYQNDPVEEVRPPDGLPSNPVVLVTGGLGYMGLTLAEAMYDGLGAKLVLLGRSALPPAEEWAAASADGTRGGAERELLRRLGVMHAQRDDVLVLRADVSDGAEVRAAVDEAIARFGAVDVVVHGAANVGAAAFGAVGDTDVGVLRAQMTPKLDGVQLLMDAMRGREPRRWVLHGSISAELGGLGLAAYAGANAVLNGFAEQGIRSGQDWLCVEWDAWDNAGEAQAHALKAGPITPAEGRDAFLRILGAAVQPRIVVSVQDLDERVEAWVKRAGTDGQHRTGTHPRPDLTTAYVEPRTDLERTLAEIWSTQLGIAPIGIYDRFFELGGHSLLLVQVAAEIRTRLGADMPVFQLFKAPTVGELAAWIDSSAGAAPAPVPAAAPTAPAGPSSSPETEEGPRKAAKDSYRTFYDDISKRLAATGMGEASYFLNYGYVSVNGHDDATHPVPEGVFNANSVRLAYELVGPTPLSGRTLLDVGCGRGGTAALLAQEFGATVTGIDLSPEAITFCQQTHADDSVTFTVGDAEHLPFPEDSFDVVTNLESSHTYPDLRAFLSEVGRVLRGGGTFLYTDLLPVQRWTEVRMILSASGFTIDSDREITANVLASCDEVAAGRTQAFGDSSASIENFLAVPGSPVYEQMRTGAWQYRILRSHRA